MTDAPRILLGINIDHVATLRQARGTRYPDPVKAALDAEEAGAGRHPDGHGEEQEHGVLRVLDGRPEPDDRERSSEAS